MKNGGAARLQKRGRVVVIASALMMTTALAPVVLFAPDANAQVSADGINAEHTFDIPAQSLTSALAQFGVQAGVQVTVDGALARGIDAPTINGTMRASTALEALLRGSGLDYDVTSDGTVVIETVTSSAGEEVLETLRVEANAAEATDPTNAITDSFVASRSRTASKTDTPILDDSSAVSVVTQEELETRNVQDLQQAVSYTAGVQAAEYGADYRYDYVRLRGFSQTNLGTYRDGLSSRVYNFITSRPETYGLQQVDVLKGSTSSLFGMNGPGGLINMTTKRPQDEASGEVLTTFGENHLRGAGDVTGPVGENSNWSYRLTALWQDAERGQDYSQDDRIYVAPAFSYTPNADTKLTILTSYSDRESGLGYGFPAGIETSRDAFFGEPDFNNFDTEETNIGYELSHQINDKLEFRQNARYTHVDLTYETVYLNDTTPLGNRYAYAVYGELDRFGVDSQMQYDTAINDHFDSKTLVGIDYSRDQNQERSRTGSASAIDPYNPSYCGLSCITFDPSRATNTEITQAAYGLYAQEQLTIADDWIATVGGRFDYVQSNTDTISSGTTAERDDHKFTSRFGLTYKATDELSVYGNYSESFQPVYSSLASRPEGVKPQEGTQYELGVKYQPEAIDALFTAAVFDLTQENVSQSQFVGGAYVYKQVGEINSRGLELEGKVSLDEQTNMTVAYTYLDAEIKDDVTAANIGNRPANVPEHQASAWLDYTIPGQGALGDLTLGGGVRFVGERQRNDGNTETLPSNSVFDAAINYAVTDDVSLSVNATNLFDREYVSSNTFGSRFYGEGRTVLATLKYSW